MRAAATLALLFFAMAMSVAEMDPRMARSNRFVVNSMPVWTRFCNVRSIYTARPTQHIPQTSAGADIACAKSATSSGAAAASRSRATRPTYAQLLVGFKKIDFASKRQKMAPLHFQARSATPARASPSACTTRNAARSPLRRTARPSPATLGQRSGSARRPVGRGSYLCRGWVKRSWKGSPTSTTQVLTASLHTKVISFFFEA